ncbi:related to NADH pyrophosphatase [Cephalotrichum gorgonifer]|uniref:NAD(+) diphosphatase n=1 Tax=Cephalotrichum gorgonifer TaxID=2041049 RepID=A0AAE8MYB7_9PEZI|nr:related to NADH pyrophosphatase [Cephalotrichum gorgonifer]
MAPLPELIPVRDDGSVLSKKFGSGVNNYYSGCPLNRVSFLREDYGFLSSAFTSSEAQFIVLNDFAPLVHDLATIKAVRREDLISVTGPDPFKLSEKELVSAYDSKVASPLVVFLGIWEDEVSQFKIREFRGRPWFSVDLTPRGSYADAAQSVIKKLTSDGSFFMKGARQNTLGSEIAAVYGEARGVTDWNLRNPFCAGCGQRTLSVHGGWKRVCTPTDLNGTDTPQVRDDCPSRVGISNIGFPRTDPTMIAAVVSSDGQRVLLGRNKKWPGGFYSTLAGFLEPGEGVEDCVRREVWEESGVKVGRVVLHSTQPWPYPASLMLGAVACALPDGEAIHLGHDPELEDAKWVTIKELRELLKVTRPSAESVATNGAGSDALFLPPHTAIAHQLLSAVAEGYAGFSGPQASL